MGEDESLLYEKLSRRFYCLLRNPAHTIISELYLKLKNISSPFNVYYYSGNVYDIYSFREFDILKKQITYYSTSCCYPYLSNLTSICGYFYEDEYWYFRGEYIKKNLKWECVNSVNKLFHLYNDNNCVIFTQEVEKINIAVELSTFIYFRIMQQKYIILIIVSYRNRNRKNKKHWLPNELFNFILEEFLF